MHFIFNLIIKILKMIYDIMVGLYILCGFILCTKNGGFLVIMIIVHHLISSSSCLGFSACRYSDEGEGAHRNASSEKNNAKKVNKAEEKRQKSFKITSCYHGWLSLVMIL